MAPASRCLSARPCRAWGSESSRRRRNCWRHVCARLSVNQPHPTLISAPADLTHESDKTLTTDASTETTPEKTPETTVPTFRDLGVLPQICDSLEEAGIVHPFAIQEMTL